MDALPSERFAANLQGLRGEARLPQEELAFRAGMHRTQISLLERGDRLPRFETVVRLCGGLGATPNDLHDGITWDPIVTFSGGLVVNPAVRGE